MNIGNRLGNTMAQCYPEMGAERLKLDAQCAREKPDFSNNKKRADKLTQPYLNKWLAAFVLVALVIVSGSYVYAGEIRFRFEGFVNDSQLPEIAQFGDPVVIEFILPDDAQNENPLSNQDVGFTTTSVLLSSTMINGVEITGPIQAENRFTINASSGGDPQTVRWDACVVMAGGLCAPSVTAFMRWNGGNFFELFPELEDVFDTNLPALASLAALSYCIEFDCVTATMDNYSYETLVSDTDGDSISDNTDNCLLEANNDQTDTDGDGFGNACDPDSDNNCVVNFLDINEFATAFSGDNPLFDFNGDAAVNFLDFQILVELFFMPPGPSAVALCN